MQKQWIFQFYFFCFTYIFFYHFVRGIKNTIGAENKSFFKFSKQNNENSIGLNKLNVPNSNSWKFN